MKTRISNLLKVFLLLLTVGATACSSSEWPDWDGEKVNGNTPQIAMNRNAQSVRHENPYEVVGEELIDRVGHYWVFTFEPNGYIQLIGGEFTWIGVDIPDCPRLYVANNALSFYSGESFDDPAIDHCKSYLDVSANGTPFRLVNPNFPEGQTPIDWEVTAVAISKTGTGHGPQTIIPADELDRISDILVINGNSEDGYYGEIMPNHSTERRHIQIYLESKDKKLCYDRMTGTHYPYFLPLVLHQWGYGE